MTADLITLDPKNLGSRVFVGVIVVAALVLCWFGVRWQVGDMLANLTPPTDPNAGAIASLAEGMAPGDPQASWLRASAINDVPYEDQASSLEGFEQTVRLAPYDYRWRVDLGRALEQDDQIVRAEAEFKRAVDLAPAYAYPRWHLGNFYLRQDRIDEATDQLKKATENNTEYREQVFSLAWEYFNKDAGKLESLAGDLPETRASLAYFFASHGQAVDSLRYWNGLSDRDKAENSAIGKGIALGLYQQRHFTQALEFSKQGGSDPGATSGSVTNPGFESPITDAESSWFGWQILRNDPKIEAVADSKVRHLGDKSLRIVFRNFMKPSLVNVTQVVVVEPKTQYRLRFFVRTESLKSMGGVMLEIVDANEDKSILQSKPIQTGTNDWQEVTLEFTTPANCDGILIRTIRSYCGDACSINGTIWYDDFVLNKL